MGRSPKNLVKRQIGCDLSGRRSGSRAVVLLSTIRSQVPAPSGLEGTADGLKCTVSISKRLPLFNTHRYTAIRICVCVRQV